jgi:crotonobetainyl-CoA:carnitine CoA-transferase CaiB-like acyl-CoA transferase
MRPGEVTTVLDDASKDPRRQDQIPRLRVVDVGTIIGGPFVATLLGDLGADVIKCEQPGGGDPVRLADGLSPRWQVEGRNKRSVTLNLRVPKGQELLRELASWADILVENFRPGTMARWGLGYEDLAKVNRRLVYVSVSGFGQTGPNSSRPGYDPVAAAFGGLTHMSGEHDAPPARPGLSIMDHMAALFATVGALEAVRRRDTPGGTGMGAWVDMALYAPAVRLAGLHFVSHSLSGAAPARSGVRPYSTRDGRWFVIHADQDRQFQRLADLIGDERLKAEKFASRAGRVANAAALAEVVGMWVSGIDAAEIDALLTAADVPGSAVNGASELSENGHIRARDDLERVLNARGETVTMPSVVPRIVDDALGGIRWAGQILGASNEYVYRRLLGMSEDRYRALTTEGVI